MQPEYTPKTALTHALKQKGYKMSAVKVNKVLHRNGIICKKVRMSTMKPDEKRTWWALTERGMQFGENVPSTRSVETVIYYRLDKFEELMYTIGINHNLN
jgi:hypothetical protein